MNKFLAIGLGAAAVAVALFVGVQLFGSPNGGTGGQASPSATSEPTPEPTLQPTPSAAAGLPVGSSYELSPDEPIHATIPAPGWSVDESATQTIAKNGDGSAPDGASVAGIWKGDPYIPSDPCHWESTMPDTPATTLDEIAAALGNQATRNASAPADVTVDGHAGKSITIEMPDGRYTASNNPDCDQSKFCTLSFEDPSVCHMWHQEVGQIDELWIVDLDGEFLILDGAYYSETPASVVEELGAILGSVTFGE